MSEENRADVGEVSEAQIASEAPPEETAPAPASTPGAGGAFDFVIDVPLKISVEVGQASLLVREVLQLNVGSVVELDRGANDPADVYVNGKLIAKGQVSVVDGRLAVKIAEVVGNVSGEPGGKH